MFEPDLFSIHIFNVASNISRPLFVTGIYYLARDVPKVEIQYFGSQRSRDIKLLNISLTPWIIWASYMNDYDS